MFMFLLLSHYLDLRAPITPTIVFNLGYQNSKQRLLGVKSALNLKTNALKKLNTHISNVHPLEVVSRCGETQLRVDEDLNCAN